MTPRHASLVVVLAITAAAVAGAWQKPSFRTQTVMVSVNVSVKQGRHPVTGLTSADFELLDNGVRQQVEAVSLEKVPVDVTMVLTGYPIPQAADHLRGLVSADAIRRLLPVTDRLRVVRANDRIQGRLVDADYVVPGHLRNPPTIPGVALADGLFYALAWPVAPDRRHLVVAFTNGQDSYSVIEFDRLTALVDRSDAVLHAVLWSSPNASAQPSGLPRVAMFGGSEGASAPSGLAEFRLPGWEQTFRTLMNAVSRSGGTVRHAAADASAFQAVLDDFRTSYVLSYSPRGVAARGWHELTVKVTRRGSFTVRARKGYESN
jgi:hypothetical protein